jgi:hypothetical protein
MGHLLHSGGTMSNPPKKPRSAVNHTLPADIQHAIEQQTAAFLSGGGQIQQIASGVSGQAALYGRPTAWQAKSTAQVVPATQHERLMGGSDD